MIAIIQRFQVVIFEGDRVAERVPERRISRAILVLVLPQEQPLGAALAIVATNVLRVPVFARPSPFIATLLCDVVLVRRQSFLVFFIDNLLPFLHPILEGFLRLESPSQSQPGICLILVEQPMND